MRKMISLILILLMSGVASAQDVETATNPYEIALTLIQSAQDDEVSFFDLNVPGLVQIPPEIGTLENLYSLIIQGTAITSLPPEIGNLRNLQGLNIQYNYSLTSLPAEIGNLERLRQLFAYGNHLESIPSEIGNLQQLRTVRLYSNQLTALPDEIGNLTSLEELDVSYNPIISLPDTMGNLSNLCILDIRQTSISSIPDSLNTLPLLTEDRCTRQPDPFSPLKGNGLHTDLMVMSQFQWIQKISLVTLIILAIGVFIYRKRRVNVQSKTKRIK